MSKFIIRKTARKTALYMRYISLTSVEQVILSRLEGQKKLAITLLLHGDGIVEESIIEDYLIGVLEKINDLKLLKIPTIPRVVRRSITISSIKPWFSCEFLRF